MMLCFHETNLFGVGFPANMWLFFPQPPLFILPPPAEKKINDSISHS